MKKQTKKEMLEKVEKNEKKKLNSIASSNKAITLIALVITIIVLIILAAVSIYMIFGNNGVIDRSIQAKFISNFSQIEEKVMIYQADKVMDEIMLNKTLSKEEKLPIGQIADKSNFKDTLITEIETISSKDLADVELYYIDQDKIDTNINREYVIDINTMQIYDVDGEKFLGKVHHTLNGVDIPEKLKPDVIEDTEKITIDGDVGWYSPNVDGFNGTYSYLQYYNRADYSDIKEVGIKEYIQNGKLNKIEENGKTYVLDNYSNKEWANIKTIANGLECWWVWIPRYAYMPDTANQKMEVIFIDLDNNPIGTKYSSLPSGYIVHPGFTKTKTNEAGETVVLEELQGIWMSKYEPSTVSNKNYNIDTGICYAPDMTGFDKNYTYIEFYNEKTQTFDSEKLLKDVDLNTINNDGRWYDYSKKIWANVKTNANDLESWWVWIPRYAYSINAGVQEMDVIFIDLNNKPIDVTNCGEELPENFIVHPAFTVTREDGTVKELKGIWMSKYEPANTTNTSYNMDTAACYEPDMSGFDTNYTYIELYNEETQTFDEEVLLKTANLKTVNNNGKWYNYSKKIWANVKTNANGLECWWVWIPRYAYCVSTASQEMDVIFVDLNNTPIDKERYGNTLPENFIVHPAFTVTNSTGTIRELKGIWMSKYEPSEVKDVVGGTIATGSNSLPQASDQAGNNHTHIGNGAGTTERYVTKSTKWCSAYDGTPCSNYGYYIYCSECGVRLRHYWCKAHYNPNTKVIIDDSNVE